MADKIKACGAASPAFRRCPVPARVVYNVRSSGMQAPFAGRDAASMDGKYHVLAKPFRCGIAGGSCDEKQHWRRTPEGRRAVGKIGRTCAAAGFGCRATAAEACLPGAAVALEVDARQRECGVGGLVDVGAGAFSVAAHAGHPRRIAFDRFAGWERMAAACRNARISPARPPAGGWIRIKVRVQFRLGQPQLYSLTLINVGGRRGP